MVKKDKDICRIWDVVVNDHPDKSGEWCMQMTCEFYRIEFNDEIDHGDVADALEARENAK